MITRRSVHSRILPQLLVALISSSAYGDALGAAGCLLYYGETSPVCLPPQATDLCTRTDIDVEATFGTYVGSLCTAQKTYSQNLQTAVAQVTACQADEQNAKEAADAAEGAASACLAADAGFIAQVNTQQKTKDKVLKSFTQLQGLLKKLCKNKKSKNKCPKYDDKLPGQPTSPPDNKSGSGTADPFLGIWGGTYRGTGAWYFSGLTFLSSNEVYEGVPPMGFTKFNCSTAPKSADGKSLKRCGRYAKTANVLTITWGEGARASYTIQTDKDTGKPLLREAGEKSCPIGDTDYACLFEKAVDGQLSFLANATWSSKWQETVPGSGYSPGSGGYYSGGTSMTFTADGRFQASSYSGGSINFGTGGDPTGYNPGVGMTTKDKTAGRWEIVDRYTVRLFHDTGEVTQHTFFGSEWPAGEAIPKYLYLEGYGVTRMYCRGQFC